MAMCRSIPFSQMEYSRIALDQFQSLYAELERRARAADSPQALLDAFRGRYAADDLLTNRTLCQLHYDMDGTVPFWKEEKRYWDALGPILSELDAGLTRALLASPFRAALSEFAGPQAMAMLENSCRGFDEKQVPLLQEENRLMTRYGELMAEASVLWDGARIPRSLMPAAWQSSDRAVRRRASEALGDSWQAQRAEIEELFDRLVKNRTQQARLAGFPSYVELSYLKMNRLGYNADDVRAFRDEVKKSISPLYEALEKKRAARLGLDHLYCYDGGISFPNGNPVPLGDTAACLEYTRALFHKIAPETGRFIDFLLDNGLYDVEPREGKRGGGYMTPLEKYRSLFLLVSFDGTDENAYVMSHEGGHAFQLWLTRGDPVREHRWLTSETAETHAMAMEFFAAPHMELFFGDRAADYRQKHLETAIMRIAYQCEQDEFQELVYRNPDMSPADRNALWRELDEEYLPGHDASQIPNLREGCGWQRIPHAFYWPFYAIDYALAQAAALEYRAWMARDPDAAWQSYLTLCRRGGTMDFRLLLRAAELDDPFAAGSMARLAASLRP